MNLTSIDRRIIRRFSAMDDTVKPPPLLLPSPKYSRNRCRLLRAKANKDPLPYIEEDKLLIRQHINALTDAYPSLRLRIAKFTHNTGQSVKLLRLKVKCIIPTIPIVIWLVECYPHFSPLVFVEPGSDMIINGENPWVSSDGSVSIPYLENWDYCRSNLVELAQILSQIFEIKSPLHYKCDHDHDDCISRMDSMVSFRSGAILPAENGYQPSPGDEDDDNNSITSYDSASTDYPEGKGMEILSEKLQFDMGELSKSRDEEIEVLFRAQEVLDHRKEELEKLFAEMSDEKKRLEQEMQLVSLNTEMLNCWFKENEEKLGNLDVKSSSSEDDDIDRALEPCDELSKQLLDCCASDLAIDDTMYAMDKALQEGAIPFDQYQKGIRNLSREQFFHRATASKVRDIQMQDQVFKMASR